MRKNVFSPAFACNLDLARFIQLRNLGRHAHVCDILYEYVQSLLLFLRAVQVENNA